MEKPQTKGGLIKLRETEEIVARLILLTKKFQDLLTKKQKTIKVIDEVPETCDICELHGLVTRNCPTLPTFKEVLHKKANAFHTVPQPANNLYSQTYNPSWKNYQNLQWK